MDKQLFAQRIIEQSLTLVRAINTASDTEQIYFDEGFNSGGADPIVDGDVSGLGVTAAQLAAFITLSQQLQNFADNAAVTTGDYRATLNGLRGDI